MKKLSKQLYKKLTILGNPAGYWMSDEQFEELKALEEFKRLALEFASRFVDKVKKGEGVPLGTYAGMRKLFLTYGGKAK